MALDTRPAVSLSFFIVFTVILIFAVIGCSPVQLDPEEPISEDPEEPEEIICEEPVDDESTADKPLTDTTHYWPWISHGHLDLSSAEIIPGPDLFESDPGFIAEFTEDYSFDGLLVWPVKETDVFTLEWIMLSFNVDYYDLDEQLFELYFEFIIEDLQPEPGDEGIQEFTVNLSEQQRCFEVVIKKVLLGKGQESKVSAATIDFVALELEMKVNPN